MKKLKSIFNSRLGFSVAVNLITLFTSIVLFRPFWEEGDDVGMALLAEGAYGHNEAHLIYSNVIYGKILCVFQQVFPFVRWHSVLMYVFIFAVSVAFVYILSKNGKGKLLSVIFLVCVFYELLVALQFSKVAAYVGMVAYVLMFETVRDKMTKKEGRLILTVAMICEFYTMILRDESFLLATMIAGCYGLCLVVHEYFRGEFSGKIKSYLKVFIPVFALFGVCFFADKLAYSTGGWKEYMDYYETVTELEDYNYEALLYSVNGDRLKALGVSENDANMFITYQSLEDDVTSKELLSDITSLNRKGLSYVDVDFMKAWIANIYNEINKVGGMLFGYVILLGILIAYITDEEQRKFYIANLAVQAVITVIVMFYYQYSARWNHRVFAAFLLTQIILFIYLIYQTSGEDIGRKLAVCVFMILGLSVLSARLGNEFSRNEFMRESFDHRELIGYMQQHKEMLFVTDVFTMIDYGKYDVFTPAQRGQFDNCLQTDSAFVANTPVNKEISGRYGYASPFEALCAKDKAVVLVDAISPEVELGFCNEHKGGTYSLEELGTAGNIGLYSIR